MGCGGGLEQIKRVENLWLRWGYGGGGGGGGVVRKRPEDTWSHAASTSPTGTTEGPWSQPPGALHGHLRATF